MEFYERYPQDKIISFHYVKSLTLKQLKDAGILTGSNEDERKKYYRIIMNFCDGIIKTNGEVKRLYKFTGGNTWGEENEGSGRLFCGNSIQGIQRDIRGLFLNGFTTDIDMVNAHPVILLYICKINNEPCPNLEYYVNHRDEILSRFETRDKGKLLFLKATNNDKLNKKERDEVFKEYDKEMKTIQKNITMKEHYKKIVNDVDSSKLYNWYGSAINRILCHFENKILQVIINELNKRNIEILAPMFDGVILYGIHSNELLRELENAIENKFPNLNMKLTKKDHSTLFQVPDDFEIVSTGLDENSFIATDDNEASNILFENLKDIFKSCEGRLFYKDNYIWISDRNKIDDLIFTYIMDKSNIYRGYDEEKQKPIPYAQNVSCAKRLREALYSKIIVNNEDYNLYEKFHTSTKGKLCFQDGVLDFKERIFTKWEDIKNNVIYTTTIIKRDFYNYFKSPIQNDIDDIKINIFQEAYGNDTDLALQFYARGIAGHNEDKVWSTYLGNRNCGKSLQYDLLKNACGDYVSSFEIGNIMYCRKGSAFDKISSVKLYWTLDLEFVRLAISQEIPDDKKDFVIDGKSIKKLTGGGDEMIARRNYDRFDTKFYMDTTLMAMGNSQLIVDTPDCNETRLEFSSVRQFISEEELNEKLKNPDIFGEYEMKRYKKRNPELKMKCKTEAFGNAMVMLLYDNYKNKQVEIRRDIEELEQNDLLKNLLSKYIITNKSEDTLSVKLVCDSMKDFDKGKLKTELMNMGIIKKKATSGDLKGKYVYVGIQIKPNDNPIEKKSNTTIDEYEDEEPEIHFKIRK